MGMTDYIRNAGNGYKYILKNVTVRRDTKSRDLDIQTYPEQDEWSALIDSTEGQKRRMTLQFVIMDEDQDMSAGTYPGGITLAQSQHNYLMTTLFRGDADQYYIQLESLLGTGEYPCVIQRIDIEDLGGDPLKKAVNMTIVFGEVF